MFILRVLAIFTFTCALLLLYFFYNDNNHNGGLI